MATATTITEQTPRKFEPRTITFPETVKEEINKWLEEQINFLTKRLENLHKHKVPEWRRIVDGTPRDENKSWPFANCSNLVHQLAGEAVDDLAARVLQLIWMVPPLVSYRYFQETDDQDQAAINSSKKTTLEQFMDYVAFDPNELDLYTRENEWYVDAAGLGKARVCVAPENRLEAVYAGYHETINKTEFKEQLLYEGPKVINLRYEEVLVDPDVKVFEDNDPIIRICTLDRRKLRERAYKGFFLKEETKTVLESPDRYGNNEIKKRENAKKGISESVDSSLAQWDIYECYFSWYHNEIKFRLIAWYHLKTKTILNCVYNFIPKNQVPIVETCLSVNKKGFAQMLKDNQEEVSTAKNQRNDAMTWGILGINRVSPQNRNIDRNFTVTPGMAARFKKDDFEHIEVANPAMAGISLQNEAAMIQQAKDRAGVGPAISGMGAGSTNKKGQFGSMGTMAVLGQGNSRNDHRQSDFRNSHVRLAGLLTDFYAFLGLGRKGTTFGLNEKLLTEALQDFSGGKLRIPVRAATASMNKEVTKQNEIILNQAVSAYIKETSSLIQAYMSQQPGQGQEYKQWLKAIIKGKTLLFKQIIRDFQLSDQPKEFIPDFQFPDEGKQNEQAPQGQPTGGPAGLDKVAEFIRQRRAGGGAVVPAGMGGAPSGSSPQGGGAL